MTCAPTTLESEPSRLVQPLRASAASVSVLSQPRILALRREIERRKPVALVARLIAEHAEHHHRTAAAERLQASVASLETHAEEKGWSLRTLTKKTGLSLASFRRVRSGNVDPITWLPKLEAAIARLNPS